MPGGARDSSKTRVKPVFDLLWAQREPWVRHLLELPRGGCPDARIADEDLTPLEGFWEPTGKQLNPPVSLLSWMIRNAGSLRPAGDAGRGDPADDRRQRLRAGEPAVVEEALRLLRSDARPKGWNIFEGPTSPDVFLVTPDALIAVEGKRTELGPTTYTKWLSGRHQMWRHIDAAWEIRGRRSVYGFFIVEGSPPGKVDDLPSVWRQACESSLSDEALQTSLPHRSLDEAKAISRCFLGATTWQAVCESFGLDWQQLPDRAGQDRAAENRRAKRDRERVYVHSFLGHCPDYGLAGDSDDQEAPDFILRDADGLLGLEVTQVFRSHGKRGSPERQGESKRAKLLAELAEAYYAAGGLPAKVDLLGRARSATIESVVELLREARPQEDWASVRVAASESTYWITALPKAAGEYRNWRVVDDHVGWVRPVTGIDLEARIREKSKGVEAYKAATGRAALLLVMDRTLTSGMLAPDASALRVESFGFDAIFLLEYPAKVHRIA